MVKKTHAGLIFVIIVLLVFQTIAVLHFSQKIEDLEIGLNDTKNELEYKINENYIQTQDQLGQLTFNLIETKEDFTKQVSELKAVTSADFSGIIEKVIKSVVSIKTDVSQGSGFIVNSEGYLITNAHVLQGAHFAKALTYAQELKNAIPIGIDVNADIALLKIPSDGDFLKFGDSEDIKVGEKVIAVGNPYGLSFTVTEGIVSATNRVGLNNIEAYIQTDVALNPGNSGGPLINNNGEVIGINNFKVGGAESLGFALESNYAKSVINNIAKELLNKTIV